MAASVGVNVHSYWVLAVTAVSVPRAQATVPVVLKVPPSVVSPASARVLPLAEIAVYLGAPVGVALLMVTTTVAVASA